MILVGDIGGTHARLALAEPGTTEPIEEWRAATADFRDFPSVLTVFLESTKANIDSGCLAIAGPIADDGRSARLTNLDWPAIDVDALEARFGLRRLMLVNDFAAAAMGVTAAPAESIVPLQDGEPLPRAPKLVIGAGTGLGMATLIPRQDGWRVLPGEGGHVGFAPQSEDQARIWQALLAEHGRVTCERVISGPGLAAIHKILAGADLDPAAITQGALVSGDAACRRSVDVFLSTYGAFAGDMAMAVLARGGVFLAGGIAAKLLPRLPMSPFLAAFNAKAEHAELVRRMPVAVVTDPSLGLRGAAVLAAATR